MTWDWLSFASPVAYEIEEVREGLVFRCRAEESKAGLVLGVALGVGFAALAFRTILHWGGVLLGAVAVWSSMKEWNKKVGVDLTVTDKGIETSGYFGRSYEPIRWMLWPDLIRFEYSRGTAGEDGYTPRGVWAIGVREKTCILPGLDEAECDVVIRKIYERFPHAPMAVDAGYRGIFRDEPISLELNR